MEPIGIPLAAGFIGSRLQGHAMNSKENPLQEAGYDYGDTLWGTGEGWGHFSSVCKNKKGNVQKILNTFF
jgi:hypothetical protein